MDFLESMIFPSVVEINQTFQTFSEIRFSSKMVQTISKNHKKRQ